MSDSSLAHELNTRADAVYAGWVNEKAKYPGDRSGAAEITDGDVSRSELPSRQRVNVRSLHEMFGSTPFDTSKAGSDSIDDRKLGLQALVTPPLIDMFDTSVPTDLELPTVDPVYWTAELRDRASFNIADAHTVTSFMTSQDLQADSVYGKNHPNADTLGESFTKFSHFLDADADCASNPFHNLHEGIANICPSMPSPGLDFPVPQTASPSTPSPSLISQLSSAVSLSSRTSTLISPTSNLGSQDSRTRQVPAVSAVANLEDGINAWRSQSSTLPPPNLEETQSQARLAKLRANTIPASDSTGYHRYSSSERQQIPIQTQKLGTEADYDHGPHLGANPAQIRTQVEDLLGLVRIVNNEWMQRLLPSPELHIRCSSLSARTLLAKGIYTLKNWLCGKLESNFEEVFSFMHVAFAAAFILHHKDESHCWDAFFQDALQLQHAMVDREGKLMFVTAMDRWWWLPGQQSTSISILLSLDC